MSPYWIEVEGVRLAIVSRPRGWDWLLDDIRELKKSGFDAVVSLLTQAEMEELGLAEEARCCGEIGIEFLPFVIEDRSVPSSADQFCQFVGRVDSVLKDGKAVAVHCRAGIGRSSITVASLLIQRGFLPDAAFRAIESARGCPVPDTSEQRQWIEQHIPQRLRDARRVPDSK